jgi:thiol-disulfide isomerase/thioredoxin
MQMRRLIFLVAMMLVTASASVAAPATQPASPVVADITGVDRHPLDVSPSKAVVIIFISTDCPISNGYAPEINHICKDYESKGVSFYLVHSDPDLSAADAKKHAADYGFTCPVLIDRKHEIVKRVGATVTPEAVVLGADGKVQYSGRIDDLFVALGKKRYEATTHDLRNALDAILAGKPVAKPHTQAVGCAISG